MRIFPTVTIGPPESAYQPNRFIFFFFLISLRCTMHISIETYPTRINATDKFTGTHLRSSNHMRFLLFVKWILTFIIAPHLDYSSLKYIGSIAWNTMNALKQTTKINLHIILRIVRNENVSTDFLIFICVTPSGYDCRFTNIWIIVFGWSMSETNCFYCCAKCNWLC